MNKVKEELLSSENQLRLANDKAEDLSIKKLAKNAPSLLQAYAAQESASPGKQKKSGANAPNETFASAAGAVPAASRETPSAACTPAEPPAAEIRRGVARQWRLKIYILSWKLRLMTSNWCSRLSLVKFTA